MIQLAKKIVRSSLHAFGFEISRYRKGPTFRELYPNCRHDNGFVYDVCDQLMYQNVTDLIDYSGASWEGLTRDPHGETAFIVNEIKQGNTVIDIGANIGFYTLLLAKLVGPHGAVIAFEPGPVSFSLLKVNTILNGIKNVTLLNKSVTASSGIEYYYSNQTAESGSTTTRTTPEFGHPRERIEVEAVSLDDYFRDNDTKIDYIKMDVEGGEYNALKGMQNLLAQNPGIRLTIEYAPYLPLWGGVELQEFLDFIRAQDFKIYDLTLSSHGPVSDQYLLETYPKHQVGKYANLLLKR